MADSTQEIGKLHINVRTWSANDSRKITLLAFGIMDGKNKIGRPHREWADDIVDWYRTGVLLNTRQKQMKTDG